jgi:hypothetical protein
MEFFIDLSLTIAVGAPRRIVQRVWRPRTAFVGLSLAHALSNSAEAAYSSGGLGERHRARGSMVRH